MHCRGAAISPFQIRLKKNSLLTKPEAEVTILTATGRTTNSHSQDGLYPPNSFVQGGVIRWAK